MDKKASMQEFRALLDQFGVADDLDWLAAVLFVRNLVVHLKHYDEKSKTAVQRGVLAEIAKQNLTPESFQTVIDCIEAFLADGDVARDLQMALERERKDTCNLMDEMSTLFSAMHGSRAKQEASLTRFGEKSVQVVETSSSKAGIVKQLRGLVTDLVNDFKEEARSWEERAKDLEHSAQHDPLLSELFNRRSLDAYLADATIKAHSRNTPLSLLMIDVDDFKKVNDNYGHPAGDDLLRALSKLVVTHTSLAEGYPARYGGEELTVILPLEIDQAAKVADFIRRDVEKYEFVTRINGQLSGTIRFTISVGAAQLQPGWTPERLVSAADTALYQAKRSGKNVVITHKPS